MSYTEMCARLVTDPWFLTLDQIAELTPWQIRNIYFHERDDKGNIAHESKAKQLSYEEVFRIIWRKRGLLEREIDVKWREYCEQMRREQEGE